MTKKQIEQLNQKQQYYASTYEAAEGIVSEAKESSYLMKQQITEKHNKFGTYFLVDITYSYNVPKDIMESAAIENEAERIVHDGVKVTQDGDGQFNVDPNQLSIDDVDGKPVETSNDDVPF